jgi:tRNA (guanine26-N2/guanine27-N2)-dimethyltransferase
VTTGGPVWLTATHDPSFVKTVKTHLSSEMQTREKARKLLDTVQQELNEPTHYDHHRLCKRWNRTASSMDEVIDRLQDHGFAATRTHYGGTTFKTPAMVNEIRDATAP